MYDLDHLLGLLEKTKTRKYKTQLFIIDVYKYPMLYYKIIHICKPLLL